jgi:hypothetical protein
MLAGVRALDRPALGVEVEAFLDAHPVPQATKAIEQHRERLRVNIALRQRDAADLAAHLAPTTGAG